MRIIVYIFFTFFISIAANASNLVDELVKDLYSDDFKLRSLAAGKLSSMDSSKEISEIIEKFKSELRCSKKEPRPKSCHDPKFIYNAILVAGNLSARSHETPWDFLVYLWKGEGAPASLEGTFFSQSVNSEDSHLEILFTPHDPTLKPSRLELETFLLETIKRAAVWASCDWKLKKIVKLSKKKTVSEYQVYTYDRNYSPSLQEQYQNRNKVTWIYKGDRKITCNTASDIFIDPVTGEPFGYSIENTSGESMELEVSLYSFPEMKALCSYKIYHDGADPLNAAGLKSDNFSGPSLSTTRRHADLKR